jgi:phosphohistidine phosphatase
MKRLAVLRHAKSSWNDQSLDDFDRPLNERGWRAARRMGSELRDRKIRFDLVLASIATRVRETIDGVQEKYEFGAPIRLEQGIYLASAETLLSLIRELPDAVEAPLLVGHNPGLERLLVELTRDDSKGLRQRIAGKYPTGALAVLRTPDGPWSDLKPGSAKLLEFVRPRDLAVT